MEQFVGLDVSQKLTHICVVDREGKALWRGSSFTTPEDIAAAIRAHAPGAVRIGFERGALSTWLWHGLKKIGYQLSALMPGMPRRPSACRSTRATATMPSV
jgi:hypothetical protein